MPSENSARAEGLTAVRLDVRPEERDHIRRLAQLQGIDMAQMAYSIVRDYLEAHPDPDPTAPPLPPRRTWHHRRRPPLSMPPEPAPPEPEGPPAKRGRGRPPGSGMRGRKKS